MGVFNKLKGIFYDEVIVEEPEEDIKKVDKIVKKEVSVPEPAKEEVKAVKVNFDSFDELKEAKEETRHSERELFRSERTFNFTEFDEEEELPPRKTAMSMDMPRQSRVVEPVRPVVKPTVVKPVEPPQPKVFKPSPIISPIYGILDKDYKKDEIKTRTVVSTKPSSIKLTSYDAVRRKAYGTLEDELEDTLNSMENVNDEMTYESVNNTDDFTQNNDKAARIEELINQIDDVSYELDKSMSIGEIEDSISIRKYEFGEDVTDKTMTDSSLEHDLFNLIDSMYDDKED